jgi:hypothetical protein
MSNEEQEINDIIAARMNEPIPEIVAEEIPVEWEWERLRLKRDSLLKKCDYRIVADAPWDVQPWIDYRQALRDLPKKNKDPKKIVFPNPPA